MKKLLFIPLIALFSCDKIKEDVLPEINVQPVIYAKSGGESLVALYGDFDRDQIQVTTNSDRATQIGEAPFVSYQLDNASNISNEIVQLEVRQGNKVVGNASVEVRQVNEGDCFNGAFSDSYVVNAGEELRVNLLENDAFCDFVDTGSRGVSVFAIANTENVLVAVAPNEASLTYTSPEGFTGTVEFIYELCFGLNGDPWAEGSNPIDICTYYYTALATIEVI